MKTLETLLNAEINEFSIIVLLVIISSIYLSIKIPVWLKRKPKRLVDGKYYEINTIGKYRGTKIKITECVVLEGNDSCEGCISFLYPGCKSHNFLCDKYERKDGRNIILKEIQ